MEEDDQDRAAVEREKERLRAKKEGKERAADTQVISPDVGEEGDNTDDEFEGQPKEKREKSEASNNPKNKRGRERANERKRGHSKPQSVNERERYERMEKKRHVSNRKEKKRKEKKERKIG